MHKISTEDPAGQTLYRALSLHIYGEGKIYFDSDMEKKEVLITFLKGQNARHGSSLCPPALN